MMTFHSEGEFALQLEYIFSVSLVQLFVFLGRVFMGLIGAGAVSFDLTRLYVILCRSRSQLVRTCDSGCNGDWLGRLYNPELDLDPAGLST